MKPSFVSCPSLCQITYLCPLHCHYWGRQVKTKQMNVSPLTVECCKLLFRTRFSAENWHNVAGLIGVYTCVAWSFLQEGNSDNSSHLTKSQAWQLHQVTSGRLRVEEGVSTGMNMYHDLFTVHSGGELLALTSLTSLNFHWKQTWPANKKQFAARERTEDRNVLLYLKPTFWKKNTCTYD